MSSCSTPKATSSAWPDGCITDTGCGSFSRSDTAIGLSSRGRAQHHSLRDSVSCRRQDDVSSTQRGAPMVDQTRDPAATVASDRIATACFYTAGIVSLIGAMGLVLGSAPDIQGRLGVDPETYWNNRLQTSLILGAIGLFFGVIVTLIAAYLASSPDRGRRSLAASFSSSRCCRTLPASSPSWRSLRRTGRTPSLTSSRSCWSSPASFSAGRRRPGSRPKQRRSLDACNCA